MSPRFRKEFPFPGGYISPPALADYPAILNDIQQRGCPRAILRLLGWTVGDEPEQHFRAALCISLILLAVTIVIYVFLSLRGCGYRRRQRKAYERRIAVENNNHRLLPDREGEVDLSKNSGTCTSAEKSAKLDQVWTVHNKRYDLRGFAASHPGGVDAICLGQGRNCTELFESYHSLANEKLVRAILARYYVEDAPEGAADYDTRFQWKQTPFYDELKKRVRAHFGRDGGKDGAKDSKPSVVVTDHHADRWQWLQLIVFNLATAYAFYGFLQGKFLSALLLPFCYWWGPSPCMHDGGHFALSRHPWVNRLCAHLGGAHMSLLSWYHQHTVGHHVHTNMVNLDPDLYHFSLGVDQGTPGFRTSLKLRTLPERASSGLTREKFWRQGLKFRIPMSTVGPSLAWDVRSVMTNSFLGVVPYWLVSDFRMSLHSVGRSVVIWAAIIHPITISLVSSCNWLYGLFFAMLYIVLPYAVHGCLFYVFSQVSHVQAECFEADFASEESGKTAEPKTLDNEGDSEAEGSEKDEEMTSTTDSEDDEKTPRPLARLKRDTEFCKLWHHSHPRDKREILQQSRLFNKDIIANHSINSQSAPQVEWAVHQLSHTLDYAVDSQFWLHVSNGLNLQTVHHLFPQVGWGRYPEISVIIKELCAEFKLGKVRYNTQPTFWAALSSHFAYLKAINDGPLASVWIWPEAENAHVDVLNDLDEVDWKLVPRNHSRKHE